MAGQAECAHCRQMFESQSRTRPPKYCYVCVPDIHSYNRMFHYNITEPEFQELLRRQENRCGICRVSFDDIPEKFRHVDHCHETGKVRGVLCVKCNTAIGHLDTLDLLQRALQYFQRGE